MKQAKPISNSVVRGSRLRIGIVATEFPPMVGGMEQHAFGLANALAETDDVSVYTHLRNLDAKKLCDFSVIPILEGRVYTDYKLLSHEPVDFWLTLNAGYSVLSNYLSKPVFAYCHGNDFLNPWISLSGLEDNIVTAIERVRFFWRYAPRLSSTFNNYLLYQGLSKARVVFVNSSFTRSKLFEVFPRLKQSILVSHPGVNNFFYENLSKFREVSLRPNFDVLRLVTIARLTTSAPKKNVDNIIRAIARLSADIPIDWKIAGDGDRRRELEALARNSGASHCSSFLGNIPNNEIPKLLDEADLFVLPSVASLVDVESFGIVYAEAAARGIPSLISKKGGSIDAVENGVTGIVIDGSSPDEIANGIKYFWLNRRNFNPNAIRAFAERFRWNSIAMSMRKAIEEKLLY